MPACPLRAAFILVPLFALTVMLFSPRPAYADGISGFLQLSDSFVNSTDKPTGAAETKSRVNSLVQQYSLALGRTFYPSLRFSAGGLFERDMADVTANGAESSSSSTRISPNATLSFGNPFVSSAIGYTRNEVTTGASGSPSSTDVLESYDGRLSLRPEGLPTANILFSRSNTYNVNRSLKDVTSDSYSVSLRYQPAKNLDLNYQGALSDSTDRVSNVQSESITNTATANYTDRFLANRVNFFSSGTVTSSGTSFSSSAGGGVITTLLPRLAGFFAVSDNPAFIQRSLDDSLAPPITTWTSVPALIDGRKDQPISLINLGVQPLIGGETRQRNIGLDLAVTTTVSTLYLYINQNLPAAIANQLTPVSRWAVYTSSDNENWTLQQNVIQSVVFEQVFDPGQQALVQRFTINLANITTRYIKAVTGPLPQQPPPLPQGVDLNNILVTEMEAAVRTPAAQIPEQKSSSQSALLNTGVRVMLLNDPSLPTVSYDLSVNYNYSHGGSATAYTYLVNNGLTAYKKFNAFFNGSARVAREDAGASGQEHSGSFNYGVSLDAHPLRTLSHNLTYSGRQATVGGKTSTSDSIFLTTSAALYEGISVSLAGGFSTGTSEAGSKNESTIVSGSANIIPHPTLNMNLNYSDVRSQVSGGGRADSSAVTRSGSFQAGYTPLSSLSLFFSIGFSSSSGNPTIITQSYGGGWSPFRDGALQFSVAYSESLTTTQNQRTRSVSPSLRWNIRPGWWLDVSYAHETTASTLDESTLNVVSSTLRVSF